MTQQTAYDGSSKGAARALMRAFGIGLLALLAWFGASVAVAQQSKTESFDHFKTGFALQGAHESVACESCHVRGIFKGTPTRCAGCHNNIIAVGKSADHIPTSAPCETCHNPSAVTFDVVGGFDHAGIVGNCVSCHNNVKEEGKTATHINSTDRCEACHLSTTNWDNVDVDHTQVRGRCSSCHNNRITEGQTAAHIPTGSLECDRCHQSTEIWDQVRFDHAGVSSGCVSCHNNTGIFPKPRNHVPSPDQCEQCHQYPSFSPATLFDHSQVAAQRCDGCHNGQFPPAEGVPTGHVPIPAGNDCDSCHLSTTNWGAVSSFDHTNVTGNCARCHNNNPVIGKAQNHVPVAASVDCRECHRIPPDTFATAGLFDHSEVVSQRCDACHNGQFSPAPGKTPDHVQTQPGQDCNVCHKSTLSFAGAAFDHTGITGNCASCHDGVRAPGKSARHVPTVAGLDCSACHRIPPDPLETAALFNHTQSSTQRCVDCHSGAFPSAAGKGPTHIQSTNLCEACHRTTAWNDIIEPLDHAQVQGSCNNCHLADRPATHMPTPAGSDCGICHTNPPPDWAQANAFNHSSVTSLRCDACHNGQFPPAEGINAATHIPIVAGQDCDDCHVARPAGGGWTLVAPLNHSLVTSIACSRCHSGQFVGAGAAGKGANHFVTTAECDRCHTTAAGWAAPITVFRHQSANYPGDHNPAVLCLDCHTTNNQNATWRNTALRPFCAGCHEADYDPGPHDRTVTPPTQYTAAELKDCTGACHLYSTAVGGAIANNRPGPEHRVNAGGF